MKKLGLALAALAVSIGIFFLFRYEKQKAKVAEPDSQIVSNSASPLTQASPSVPPAVPPPPGADPVFVEFLGRESVALDSTTVNTEDAEQRSRDQASSMGPLEIQYARDTVLSGKGNANQRVLALYLLTLAGPKAAKALGEIALSPLPDGRVAAHSEEEHTLMQEKAQRVTAIDALSEQAKTNPESRASLERLAEALRDPGLRAYALKKLREIASN